jgi:hypothetical protein
VHTREHQRIECVGVLVGHCVTPFRDCVWYSPNATPAVHAV